MNGRQAQKNAMDGWNWMRGKRWRIQDRILTTLLFLTAAILFAVALAFHLFIRAYIWNRASTQLDAIADSVSFAHTPPDRGGNETGNPPAPDAKPRNISGKRKPGQKPGQKPDGRQDRVTGVLGNAVALDADGAILDAPAGEAETAAELSAYFSAGGELNGRIRREALTLDSGNYILSVVPDPLEENIFWACYVDVTAIEAFTRQANLVLCAIICAALLLSGFLSRWISRAFAEPVQRLSAFAQEIGRGDFRRREFPFRDAEFHALAESMNRMADELKESKRKQETFFQNVSHELRTPLTAIRGNAEGIACGLMKPKESANTILAEADRLTGFVEDILYLSRMGRAAPEGSAPPLDLRDVLSLCVSEQRTGAGRLSFSFDFDETPVLLEIRERDARQLFGNLISNAIRYADKEIRLSCHTGGQPCRAEKPASRHTEKSGVWVRVCDDGPGILPEDLPHIFERFYKGAGGKHGIGLSIVRTVADAYHGKITVETGGTAAGNGGGAAFTVWFPGSGKSRPSSTEVPSTRKDTEIS